jgi:hypothetical protein
VEYEGVEESKGAADRKVELSSTSRNDQLDEYGAWRRPQRSATAYVRCILEAMYYMLRRRSVTEIQAKMVCVILIE